MKVCRTTQTGRGYMNTFRKISRFILILAWLPIIGIVSFFVHIGGWGAIRRVSRCTRIWGKGVAWLWGIRTTLHGDISDFKGGLILANHTGYLDILVCASLFPIRFAPKKEIKSWPLLGWYLGISRPVWVDRKNPAGSKKVMEDFRDTMKHGIPLLVYPEGTSSDGVTALLPFKSTPFEAVCETGYPILPILIYYHTLDDGTRVGWHGTQKLMPNVWHMLEVPRIKADVYVLPQIKPQPGESRKDLSRKAYELMNTAYLEILAKNASEL